jgi:hypothetical protein
MSKRHLDRIDTRPTGMLGKELQYLVIQASGEAFWHDKPQLCGAILIIAPIEYINWHDKASIVPVRDPAKPRYICTERGAGYVFSARVDIVY